MFSTKVRVQFPIGFKFIVITLILLLVSLGTITVLVSALISEDIRLTAADTNFSFNERSASDAEETLECYRSNANVLLNVNTTLDQEQSAVTTALFFDEHSDIALVASTGGPDGSTFINEGFFVSTAIGKNLVESFLVESQDTFRRAAQGETLILNGTPFFGIPVLALFYPLSSGAALIIFSSKDLAEKFGTGANTSYLVNDAADILVHPNQALMNIGANAGNQPFVRLMNESSSSSLQSLYTDDDGGRYFGAFTKLSAGNSSVLTTVEYDRVFEGISTITRRNMYLTAAVLCIAGIFIYLFSKSISSPIRTIAAAAGQIEIGRFEVAVITNTRDEVGLLADSFTRMSKALGVFGRFTNREIALRAMRGEIKPGGLLACATIFFSDIRNFTEKSEKFTHEFGEKASEKIVSWLNEYFTSMVECIEKTGGVVDKFIGDAVMAHWGTAYGSGNPAKDAYNCVKAALLMRTSLAFLNKERNEGEHRNPPIRIGCGINTGIVTAG
jgi:adenylate cyclase